MGWLKRFFEIAKKENLLIALYKLFNYAPKIIISEIAANLTAINSKSYWNIRLLFNWNISGEEQTKDFAESLFKYINFESLDKVNSILDFGCAYGNSVESFNKYLPHAEIYLWDLSQFGLSIALRKFGSKNVYKWDNKKKCDLVYCSNVIEHVNDLNNFINNLIKASRKYVIIQCPFQETHQDGRKLTPNDPIGEHIWTIDDDFIDKYFIKPCFSSTKVKIGMSPKAWPFGKQLFFLGKLK